MGFIEERVKTFAKPNVVFKAWADKYLQQGFEKNQKGYVVNEKKKGIKFKIEDIEKNHTLTVVWFSHFVKLKFYHIVEEDINGSLVTCKVQLKGFFAVLIKPLIAKKIKKNLQVSLTKFARDLNLL
ncbi:MAG: hypothetical protein KR126chlam4_00585 [Candidatus Anoxychlamydiales bacterium]|nr:hypothetical protein [Candidatus Anoxychlamydiales bacterium]NGX40754.1 hypothetical protein [Candidatus Anoxychlamydiales bacterium]HEU64949.1 hypothetical protein [Chlamydiota bacterium]